MTSTPQAHSGDLILLCACANIGVTVDARDGKVVVGRTLTFVDSTIELACTGIAHKQGQGSPLPLWPSASLLRSGQRHGRWCRVRAPSSAQRRVRPISDLFQPYVNANDRMTHATRL